VKLLEKRAGCSDELWQHIVDIIWLCDHGSEHKTILYFVVPRGTQKWYCGKVNGLRKENGQFREGFPVRNLEHVAGGAGAQGRRHGGPKYRLWQRLGVDAVLMIPWCQVDDTESIHVEDYVISREQPGANQRSKKLDRQEKWLRRNANMCLRPRGPVQWRSRTSVRDAIALNFWSLPREVWKAKSGSWRTVPPRAVDPKEPVRRRPSDEKEIVEITVDTPWKLSYGIAAAREAGPVDIYVQGNEVLCLTFLARPQTPVVKLQAERLGTAQLMQM
jgi:hypothetical protein